MGKLQTRLSRNIILTRKVGVCHFAVWPTICRSMNGMYQWQWQFFFLVTLTFVHLGTHGGKSMIKRACSQRNESRSESGFESWSALWFGSWFELCAFTCIANAVPITNRICTLRGNILFLLRSPRWFLASARISKMRTHKSHSERALCSNVLGIRLSMRIMIQNASLFAFQNAFQKPDLKEHCVHKG